MKKLIKLVLAMAFASFSTSAMAVPVSTVVSYDSLLSQTTLGNSGSGTEEAWIESVLGFNITYTQLVDSGATAWEAVTGGVAGDYAYDFGVGTDPAYFLVKVGGGGGTGTTDSHFLFENVASLQWAFVNLETFGSGVSLTNYGIISHTGITGPGTTVPEPGMVGLLAMGLIGVVVARRKMKV